VFGGPQRKASAAFSSAMTTGKAARVPVAAQRSTTARTSGSCLIGQQKARTSGGEKRLANGPQCAPKARRASAALKAARRATISRRNARRQAVLSSFACVIKRI
jgi:hypothetical protein